MPNEKAGEDSRSNVVVTEHGPDRAGLSHVEMCKRQTIVTCECLDCNYVGSPLDAKRHAEDRGCKNFRVTTRVLSASGEYIDELVEVYRI